MNVRQGKAAFISLAACVYLAAAGACHASGILPLSPGSTWTYRDLQGNIETLALKGVTSSHGIPLIEASYGDRAPFFFILSEEGLFRLTPAPGTDPDSPRGDLTLLTQRPLEPGRTWQSPWSDPPLFFEVLSRGPVIVPAGSFRETVKIGYRPATDPIFSGFMWITPGVGIVAQEQSASRSELIAYSLSDLLPPPAVATGGPGLAEIFHAPPVEKDVPGAIPFSGRILRWMEESGVPFAFFLVLLLLFFLVIVLIVRSGRREIDLADDKAVTEAELTLCSAMVQEGLFEDAGKILQRLAANHPQWPDISALLGKTFHNTGRLEEARLELKRALTLNPDMPSVRLDLARVYLGMEDPARALTEVDTVLASDRRYADAYFCRGEALRSLGKDDLALEAFREALAINPLFKQAQDAVEKLALEPAP